MDEDVFLVFSGRVFNQLVDDGDPFFNKDPGFRARVVFVVVEVDTVVEFLHSSGYHSADLRVSELGFIKGDRVVQELFKSSVVETAQKLGTYVFPREPD